MAETDYEKVIRQLSFEYDKQGRVGHDNLLASLEGALGSSSYQILRRVVLEEYIEQRDPSNRLFGAFPEWDIRDLTVKCRRLDSSVSSSLQ